LKVVVGLDHLQTCHSQFHQSPNKTTQPTAGRVYRYAYFYVEPVFLGRNIFLAFRAGLQLVRIAA